MLQPKSLSQIHRLKSLKSDLAELYPLFKRIWTWKCQDLVPRYSDYFCVPTCSCGLGEAWVKGPATLPPLPLPLPLRICTRNMNWQLCRNGPILSLLIPWFEHLRISTTCFLELWFSYYEWLIIFIENLQVFFVFTEKVKIPKNYARSLKFHHNLSC